jgi:hypothetical protein
MTSNARTHYLLLAATLLSGLLAGGNVDRAIVAMPAWEHLGAAAWAQFSRHADLGNGIVLYPLEAIGAFLLIVAATCSSLVGRLATKYIAARLCGAALLSAAGLLCTLKAAPIMLRVAYVSDPAALQQAFEGFRTWGDLRGFFQVLAFVAAVWALAGSVGDDHPQIGRG